MFIENKPGNFRRIDDAGTLGIINDNSVWRLFRDTATDANMFGQYASEQDAQDALAELLAQLGTIPFPGHPS